MSFMNRISTGAAILALSAGMAAASPVISLQWVGNGEGARPSAQAAANTFFTNSGGVLQITDDFAGAATPGGSNVPVNPLAQDRTAGNTITTAVGTFAGFEDGGTGSGTSVTGDGSQIQVRSGNNAGRFNALTAGGNFLDSNDTLGFTWTIQNIWGDSFRGLQAFITDPNDAGGDLSVSFTGNGSATNFTVSDLLTLPENAGARQGAGAQNATIWHLTLLGHEWETATFSFRMSNLNDGFGISNASVAVIPLPAPVLMLLAALGGLVGLRRLRSKPAA
ncbi:MAG: hypothetical protein ACXIUV_01245 [Alkalilacustris sp.]